MTLPIDSTYISSPMGKIGADLLEKLALLRKKYASAEHDSPSIETIHAFKMLNTIENVLQIVHTKLLPQFDCHNQPNLLSIAQSVYPIRNSSEVFYTRSRVMFLDIKKEFPDIVTKARSAAKDPVAIRKKIIHLLEINKSTYFKRAAAIPGESLDLIFENMKHIISNIDFEKLDVTNHKWDEIILNILSRTLFECEKDKLTLTVAHPMTFELAEILTQYLLNTPATMQEFMPFLNPQLPLGNFHSGLLGTAVNAILGYTIIVEEQKIEGVDAPFYYKVTKQKGEHVEIIPVNGTEFYQHKLTGYLRELFLQIQNYFSVYEHTEEVQNQIARASLLQHFNEQESLSIEHLINSHIESCKRNITLNESESVALMHEIDAATAEIQLLLKQNEALKEQLEGRAISYESTTTLNLLEQYPSLVEELKSLKAKNMDTSYCQEALPNHVIGYVHDFSDAVSAIGIKPHLNQLIEKELASLQFHRNVLENKIQQLAKLRKEVLTNWQEAMLASHQLFIEKQSNKFEEMHAQFKMFELPNSIGNDIEKLDEALAAQRINSAKIEELHQQLLEFINHIDHSSILPSKLAPLDADNTLQNRQIHQSKAVLYPAKSLLDQLKLMQTEQHKAMLSLQSRLEKAHSAAQFAKNMGIANPEKMKQLVIEYDQNATKLHQEQEQLVVDLDLIATRINEHQEQLSILGTEIKNKTEFLDNAQNKIHIEVNALLSFVAKYTRQTTIPPNENDITQNPQLALNFIAEIVHNINKQHDEYLGKISVREQDKSVWIFLKNVETCLNSSKKLKIPFDTIEQLESINEIKGKSELTGFNLFLDLIGLNSEIGVWTIYRKNQESFFEQAASEMKYQEMLKQLTDGIKTKTKAFESERDQTEHFWVDYLAFRDSLLKLNTLLSKDINEIQRVESELESKNAEQAQAALLLKTLQADHEDKTQALNAAIIEQEQIKTDLPILKGIIEIIEEITSYEKRITLFEASDEFLLTDEASFMQIVNLQQEHIQLGQLTEEIATAAKKSHQAEVYEGRFITLYQLLESAQQSLTTTIQTKTNLSPLQEQLPIHSAEYQAISSARNQLTLVSDAEIEQLNTLCERYTELALELKQENEFIEKLKDNASLINVETLNADIKAIESLHQNMQQETQELGINLMDDLITVLTRLKNEAKIFDDLLPQESNEIHRENTIKLAEIRQSLAIFPEDVALAEIYAHPEKNKSDQIKSLRQEVEHQLIQSDNANNQLGQRIIERNRLVNDFFLPVIKDYWEKRCQIYKIKDKICPQDKEDRFNFIGKLQEELIKFRQSGDNNPIYRLIAEHQFLFDGIGLKTIVSKITAELDDFDQTIPVDLIINHERAEEILNTYNQSHPEYASATLKIYTLIDQLATANAEAAVLADKLRHDLDHFVISHPEALPNENEYLKFKKHFTARLHSEDEKLSQHQNALSIHIINFAIGFFTLGIALGIKLIHSKLSDKRCTLFFDKTNEQKQVEAMEHLVGDMAAPAA